MKGDVKAGAVVTNKFDLEFLGVFAIPKLYAVSMGEVTRELVMAEMSDQTKQSTGIVKAFEFDIEVPMHHEDQVAMHRWFNGCVAALIGHKQGGLAYYKGADGKAIRTTTLIGCVCSKEVLPAMNKAEDGKQGNAKYTISVDSAAFQL